MMFIHAWIRIVRLPKLPQPQQEARPAYSLLPERAFIICGLGECLSFRSIMYDPTQPRS